MGFPWLYAPVGDNHGHPLLPPVALISHANFDGLSGILHTQEVVVRSPPFRDLVLKWRNRLSVGTFRASRCLRVPAVKPM